MKTSEYWMNIALDLAKKAMQANEVPVGAIVVKDNQIIGQGENSCIRLNDPTAHAEIQALRQAGLALQNYRLPDCTLYVTLEPCAMCAGAIQLARISHLVFSAHDPKTGSCGSTVDLMNEPRLNYHTTVSSGIFAMESVSLLQTFFRARRNK